MLAYHMGWRDERGSPASIDTGKLIRPSLCLWAACACGGRSEDALPAAAAVEWFHNFTLVHDDIQDGDRRRHGRETVWSLWGVPQAINAGDAMHALAFLSLTSPAGDARRSLKALRAIGAAGLRVIEGQCLDLELEGRVEATLRDYLRMAGAKTGALLGAALESGALMGGAADANAHLLGLAGSLLGTAFQIQDDWLGMFGDPQKTGKSASGDAGRLKMTFPVVAGMRAMSTLQRRRVRELFRTPPDDAADTLRAMLQDGGCDELTRAASQRYARKAVTYAARAGIASELLEEFDEVAYFIATRSR